MKAIGVTAGAIGVASALQNPGPSVSVSIGSSTSTSATQTTSNTGAGSSLQAGGNVNINATASNLTIQGSNVNANNNVSLSASNAINLLASADNQTEQSSSRSSSSSVSVSYGEKGWGGGVSASRGSGSSSGSSTSYTNTNVGAGNTLSMRSGGDTNLIGATASGNRANVVVGGNLTIQSLQDTSTYTEDSKTVGVSLNYGAGKDKTATTQAVNSSGGSQATVIANNPYIPKSASSTNSMMDFLPEAARITQSGGQIIINAQSANAYFRRLPTVEELDALGLTISHQGPLLPQFQGQSYAQTNGLGIEPITMRSIVFIKK
jgi:Hemagglutinin repeat